MNSLDHNILVCDAAFHLHNFLVDYRNNIENVQTEDCTERSIFVDDICNQGVFNTVVLNDNQRPGGRPTNAEKQRRLNGIALRNHLRDQLQNHNMHRPRKDANDEWSYDRSHHIQMNYD